MTMITVALDRPPDSLEKNRKASLAALAPALPAHGIPSSQTFRLAASWPYLSVTPASLSLNPADNILRHLSKSYQIVS